MKRLLVQSFWGLLIGALIVGGRPVVEPRR